MTKFKYIPVLLLVIAIPVIIYLYFLQWKTTTMYGDDLYIYKTHAALHTFSEKVNLPGTFQKYRPVHGFGMHFLLETFKKDVDGYYCFNIAIQVINTFLFALILNLFLKSPFLSLLFSLPIGLSRFSFFNITQLFNGGALEGLAITFFLVFLFYILRAMSIDSDPVQKYRSIIKAVVFANLSMYTHERYIVLLAFVVLLVLIYPGLKILRRKQKLILSIIAIASICLNVYVKKEIYNIPFFVGTGGTNIEVSSGSPVTFFTNGLLSILEINTGPDYLVGIKFTALAFFNKFLVVLLLAGVVLTFFFYIRNIKKPAALNQNENTNRIWVVPFLIILFGMLLVPAVVTIRLEQRWLQASLIVFLTSVIIAFSRIPFRNSFRRNGAFFLLLILWLWTDFNYLKKGAANIYMAATEKIANQFEEAINKGIIRPATKKLYIWEKKQDTNAENEIKWVLAEGYFFNFYQQQGKEIIFADSLYEKDQPDSSQLMNFNNNTGQIIYMDNGIADITNEYFRDSLKEFSNRIHNP